MTQLKFLSKADQTVKIIDTAEHENKFDNNGIEDLMIHLSEMIIREFTFFDYLELDGYLNEMPSLNLLFDIISVRLNEINNLFDREISKAKLSLNEGDYILFLLNRKRKSFAFKPNSGFVKTLLEYYLFEIHSGIIRSKSVLKNYLIRGIRNDSDAMNLFLVYPKEEALTRYENYIFQQVAKHGIETVAQNLHVKMGRAQDLIGQDHMPRIDHLNYMKEEIFANGNEEYVTFEEIQAILKDQNYFKEVLPLSRLDESELIDLDTDFIKKESAIWLLEEFFREKLGLVSDRYGNKIIDVFISSISASNTTHAFKKHVLLDAQKLISKPLADKLYFQNLVGLLYVMSDQEIIKNATSKFPKILKYYVTTQALKEGTIRNYFMRNPKDEDQQDKRIVINQRKEYMENWYESKSHLMPDS